MEKKGTKATPVKVASTKTAPAKAEASVKEEVKAAAVEKEVKTVAPAVEEPKAEEVKKEEVKKEAVKKAPAKKAPAKKAPAKKAEEKPVEKVVEEVYVQFGSMEVVTKDVLERAKQAYVAEGHRESSIKSIRLYIKPEEHMAYYVINDKVAGGVTL